MIQLRGNGLGADCATDPDDPVCREIYGTNSGNAYILPGQWDWNAPIVRTGGVTPGPPPGGGTPDSGTPPPKQAGFDPLAPGSGGPMPLPVKIAIGAALAYGAYWFLTQKKAKPALQGHRRRRR